MLSRAASQLYWMSRYIERAENLARLMGVVHEISMLPANASESGFGWEAPLAVMTSADAYTARYGTVNPEDALYFLALDLENPSSLFNCIYQARENARAVRGKITLEMWESINATWLEMRQIKPNHLRERGIAHFLEWIRERSHLFRGVTYGTIVRDDAFRFIRLGTFLERADNTARILTVEYDSDVSGNAEWSTNYYQWASLLRALSALVAFNNIYRSVIAPIKVAELMILRADVPRSLHACLDEISQIFSQIEGNAGQDAERFAGALHARLHYATIDEIFTTGIQQYLDSFIQDVADLGIKINQAYLEASCA
jgi:uncharacterized alpha-E superfamily protein